MPTIYLLCLAPNQLRFITHFLYCLFAYTYDNNYFMYLNFSKVLRVTTEINIFDIYFTIRLGH
jgi:hypothetical protein